MRHTRYLLAHEPTILIIWCIFPRSQKKRKKRVLTTKGVLLLLSELSVREYQNHSVTGDIVITLLAHVATVAMHFFLRPNFICCVSRFLSLLNAWGPVGHSLRRVRIIRHFLMSLMKCIRQETASICRNMGSLLLCVVLLLCVYGMHVYVYLCTFSRQTWMFQGKLSPICWSCPP